MNRCLLPRAVAGACGIAAALHASPAAAFCRTVTAPYPPEFNDAVVSGCFHPDHAGSSELYWSNACVGYSVQRDASPLRQISLDAATAAVRSAFGQWTAAACGDGAPSVQAMDLGPVDCARAQFNPDQPNQNVIVFRDDSWPYGLNNIALTTVTFNTETGEILDADTEIDSHDWNLVVRDTFPGLPAGPGGTIDLAWVLLHEAGHFLGLAHSDDKAAVMYAYYQDALTLAPDDIAGICTIDPPGDPGTRATSAGAITAGACSPVPYHGFSAACAAAETDSGHGAGCAVTDNPASELSGCAVLGVAAVTRRCRSRRRAARPAARARWLAGLAVTLSFVVIPLAARTAAASVSVAVAFDALVAQSDAVATVTPLDRRAAWQDGRIVTYTRVRVDTLVAGQLPADVVIRSLGGVVGAIGQRVEGEPALAPGHASLVFLRRRDDGFEVTARAQGQFPVITTAARLYPTRAHDLGAVLPPSDRLTGSRVRLASEVLDGRALPDAARDIAAAWARLVRRPGPEVRWSSVARPALERGLRRRSPRLPGAPRELVADQPLGLIGVAEAAVQQLPLGSRWLAREPPSHDSSQLHALYLPDDGGARRCKTWQDRYIRGTSAVSSVRTARRRFRRARGRRRSGGRALGSAQPSLVGHDGNPSAGSRNRSASVPPADGVQAGWPRTKMRDRLDPRSGSSFRIPAS